MKHVAVFGAADLQHAALDLLQDLGVMEIHRLRAPERTTMSRRALLRLLERVRQVADSGYSPVEPESVPDDLIALARRLVDELESLQQEKLRLETILDRQRVWGDASPDQLASLSEHDVHVQCWLTRDHELLTDLAASETRLFVLERRPRGEVLFCTISSTGAIALDHARNVPPPVALRADLQRRVDDTEHKIAAVSGAIAWLAMNRYEDLAGQVERAHDDLQLDEVRSEIHVDDHVFYLTGWVPEPRLGTVTDAIERLEGVSARFRDPTDDEEPPTLNEYPAWARPIQAVFDFMGYKAGYREYDAGHIVVVFFTLFSALLINDGGYGLLILLGLAAAYRPLTRRIGSDIVNLGLYVAAAVAIFGLATGSLFGVQFASFGPVKLVKFDTEDLIRISFALGIIHLSAGRLLRIWLFGPVVKAMAELGWLAIIWGVYLAIVNVFTRAPVPAVAMPLIGAGAVAVVLFSFTDKGVGKNQLFGLGLLLGSATTVFSVVIARLMLAKPTAISRI